MRVVVLYYFLIKGLFIFNYIQILTYFVHLHSFKMESINFKRAIAILCLGMFLLPLDGIFVKLAIGGKS